MISGLAFWIKAETRGNAWRGIGNVWQGFGNVCQGFGNLWQLLARWEVVAAEGRREFWQLFRRFSRFGIWFSFSATRVGVLLVVYIGFPFLALGDATSAMAD